MSVTLSNAADYEWYVTKAGDDGYAGTVEAPWLTIQHAVDQVLANEAVDTSFLITVGAGTYNERVDISSFDASGATLEIIGESGAIVDGGTRLSGWVSDDGGLGSNVY